MNHFADNEFEMQENNFYEFRHASGGQCTLKEKKKIKEAKGAPNTEKSNTAENPL